MRRLASLLALGLVTSALPAAAEPFDLYGRTVELFLPDGYCLLDETQPAEQALVNFMTQSNAGTADLVTYFAPCNDLVALRVGAIESLVEYGVILVPLTNGSVQPAGSRAETLPQVEASMPALDEAALSQIETQLNNAGTGLTFSELKFLGTLGNDGNAVYAGLLIPVSDGTTTLVNAGVVAITVLQDIMVTVNLYRQYNSNADVVALATELQAYLGALIAANP